MIKKSVLLTALAIAGFAVKSLAQTVPNYVPTNGLVGWWPFNGNANDESGNSNNGSLGSGIVATSDRYSNINAAYYFSGAGNISLTSSPTTGNQDFTITGWVKTNNTSVRKGIACWGQDTPWSSTYFFITNNGYLNFGFAYNGGPQSSTFISDNVWHFVGVTCTSGLIQLYLDGNPTASALQMNPNINGTNKAIGANIDNSGSNNFVGALDDIGIWNRALTPSEITGLYNGNVCFQTITVTDTLLINTNITGFNPVTYQNTIKIWPNPTNDHITIDNGNLANLTGHQIKISNALGQQVFQSAITQQQFYVNMSTWGGNGIYFVNLINAQGVTIETRKIVLQ